METEQNKSKKNHWTTSKIEGATKKINQEVYQRKRQASLQIKLDDLAIYINDKIKRRGIAKGLVSIQEDLNLNILLIQKKMIEAIMIENTIKQKENIIKIKSIIKIEIWTDIRFLMINKAITPGEITELIRKQLEIDKEIEKWLSVIDRAISASN